MLIEVTQNDIDEGRRGECELCPVARAIKRASGSHCVYVDPTEVLLGENVLEATWTKLPEEAAQFIEDYDNMQPVDPFSFNLNIE